MADLIGQSLGRYQILEPLGKGGMATVYKAYDTRLETDVAVKVIRTESILPDILERALKRFEREAKGLARLTHPNIVKVMDYGEYEGKPYLVMPYLPGGTLKQKLGKSMPWQEALQLLLPVAEALGYAHSQNMIHRDVKPSNILLTQNGQPMLTDFGIAKILDIEDTMELTGTSAALGTPEYMAPEQATARTVDHRADIYALGVVLYEMVTGRKPYTADTPMAVLIMHARDPLPIPTSIVPDLPAALEKVLLKSLAKKPEDRYESMAEMAAAIRKLLSGPAESFAVREREPGQKAAQVPAKAKRVTAQRVVPSQPQSETPERRPLPLPEQLLEQREPQNSVTQPPLAKSGTQTLFWVGGFALAILIIGTLSQRNRNMAPVTPASTTLPAAILEVRTTPTKPPTRTPAPLSTGIAFGKSVDMVLVPEGGFSMGWGDTVSLQSFYIDKFEVSNVLYRACVDAGTCDLPKLTDSFTRPSYYGNQSFDNYPVINVSWRMAKTYCEWRGARLPTEAEWEKAARGVDGRMYPWGDEINCNKANYYNGEDYCTGDTGQVGSYESGRSPYGVYNMAGNVREWVSSLFKVYPYDAQDGREDPTATGKRLRRGGSWVTESDRLYVFEHEMSAAGYPDSFFNDTGFRCARDANP